MSRPSKYVKKYTGPTPEAARETRQVVRAALRYAAYRDITERFPGESHGVRRSMALSRARREYRTLKNLPDTGRA